MVILFQKDNILYQECFLYPFLFQHAFYVIAQNLFFSSQTSLEGREDAYQKFDSFSFFAVKRLIGRIHQQSSLVEDKTNVPVELITKGFLLGVDAFVSTRWKRFIRIEGVNEQTKFQSIHAVIPCLEETTMCAYYPLGVRIPCFVHPELLIRVFSCWVKDICFLHLLSSILCFSPFLKLLDKSKFFRSKAFFRLVLLFWNIFVSRWELLQISILKKKSYRAKLETFVLFLERMFFHRKMKKKKLKKKATRNGFAEVFFFSNYIRFGNNLILMGNPFLVNQFRSFLSCFWQTLFFFSDPYGLFFHKICEKNLTFIGYCVDIPIKNFLFWIKMSYNFYHAEFITRELSPKIRVISMIEFLSIEGFCDITGKPISKLSWIRFTDDYIFDRYDRSWKFMYYYYSGVINKGSLDRVKYILLFSCFKTLALKHKSTIRVVRKEFDVKLFNKFLSKKLEGEFFFSFFDQKLVKWVSKIDLVTERFWLFNILNLDFFPKSWQREQDVAKFLILFVTIFCLFYRAFCNK
uniref:Maturase K n=1 Tax=Gnetum parvifolium TaxID=33153 RepID=B7ZI64_GNEPA|nr:maturase [Gnetum parvifolium]BAH11244.1 maturase [Gnetum parvifolium]